MQAMVLYAAGTPLRLAEFDEPRVADDEILLKIHASGVRRTDLHVVDRELLEPKLLLVPGHEIVGTVVAAGNAVDRFRLGDRVGVLWLGWTCGVCAPLSERPRECLRPGALHGLSA